MSSAQAGLFITYGPVLMDCKRWRWAEGFLQSKKVGDPPARVFANEHTARPATAPGVLLRLLGRYRSFSYILSIVERWSKFGRCGGGGTIIRGKKGAELRSGQGPNRHLSGNGVCHYCLFTIPMVDDLDDSFWPSRLKSED